MALLGSRGKYTLTFYGYATIWSRAPYVRTCLATRLSLQGMILILWYIPHSSCMCECVCGGGGMQVWVKRMIILVPLCLATLVLTEVGGVSCAGNQLHWHDMYIDLGVALLKCMLSHGLLSQVGGLWASTGALSSWNVSLYTVLGSQQFMTYGLLTHPVNTHELWHTMELQSTPELTSTK